MPDRDPTSKNEEPMERADTWETTETNRRPEGETGRTVAASPGEREGLDPERIDDAHTLPPSPLAAEVRALPPPPGEASSDRGQTILTPPPAGRKRKPTEPPSPMQQRWGLLAAMICVAIAGAILTVIAGVSFSDRIVDMIVPPPQQVDLIQPQPVTINNDLPIGGVVVGTTEAVIGAQSTGTVQQLFVKQGDQVKAGQQLAILSVYGSQAQATSAQENLDTARAELSDLQSMSATDKNGTVNHAKNWLATQKRALSQAQQKLAEAQKKQQQAKSDQSSAQAAYNRIQRQVQSGALSLADLEQPKAKLDQANKAVDAAKQKTYDAEVTLKAAQEAVKVALNNVTTARANRSALSAAPSAEELRQARQRVDDAAQGVANADKAKANILTAPFDGVVKEITTPVGSDVGDSGVLTLDSNQLVIRAHVDQTAAQKLAVGQDAVFSSPAFAGNTFNAKVAQIGAAVEPGTQTVAVDLAPQGAPDWMRIGQNLNGKVILSPPVHELVIPSAAVSKVDGDNVVFTMMSGRAIKKDVVLGQQTDQGIAVTSGLQANDRIVDNAQGIKPGERIKAKS